MFAATQIWAHHIRIVLKRVRDWWPEMLAAAFGPAGFVAFCGFANLFATAAAFLLGLCLLVPRRAPAAILVERDANVAGLE